MRILILSFMTVILLSACLYAQELPDYWKYYLPDRITDIKADMKKAAGHGETFIFIPDLHVPNNSMVSPLVIREVMEKTGVDQVIMDGDYMTGHATAASGLEVMEKYV